jgi:hypothetical protein
MGEKGNGGHVATGGARAIRQAAGPSDVGLGGSRLGSGAESSGGGGLLSDLAAGAQDHATDIGGAAVEKAHDHTDEA